MVYIAHEMTPFSGKDVTVYSNCDEVRLYRNGKKIGTQTRSERSPLYQSIVNKGGSPAFVFNAGNYEAGTLKAEALIKGKIVATHSIATP